MNWWCWRLKGAKFRKNESAEKAGGSSEKNRKRPRIKPNGRTSHETSSGETPFKTIASAWTGAWGRREKEFDSANGGASLGSAQVAEFGLSHGRKREES